MLSTCRPAMLLPPAECLAVSEEQSPCQRHQEHQRVAAGNPAPRGLRGCTKIMRPAGRTPQTANLEEVRKSAGASAHGRSRGDMNLDGCLQEGNGQPRLGAAADTGAVVCQGLEPQALLQATQTALRAGQMGRAAMVEKMPV